MNQGCDTIAAIATASGTAGISVVRISGPGCFAIADRIFRGKGNPPSKRKAGTFVYGHVVEPADGQRTERIIDEVILLLFRAPNSYTCEDVVEIQGHGGPVNAREILHAVIAAGARLAEPGEFTKRAFLNGRIDLVQAEAVADLIAARSERAARLALEQLEGRLSADLTKIYDDMVAVAVDLEASLDFDSGELPSRVGTDLADRLHDVRKRLIMLLDSWHEGHVLREGLLVVIAGQPNVGKSTLLNRLLGRDRAIVADVPGTTRDTIEEQLVVDGVCVRLVDTAGLRDPICSVEKQGIDRAAHQVEQADLILYMADGSKQLDYNDLKHLTSLRDRPHIVVLNKMDLGDVVDTSSLKSQDVVRCSLMTTSGAAPVLARIAEIIRSMVHAEAQSAISERHRLFIQNALNILNSINLADFTIDSDRTVLVAGAVRQSADAIGSILGRTYGDDILDGVFKKFCVGK
ncbi:MAG: tRNA uridine-5-carboxymethylaminomethyl(34) synthesis GTPase MnmE [Verrucomicrobia bacterium]|nr:tRNA uridine-5-carboxymethylaminomethyl(34) synthesis GTPase MnmE [Verrucomicrobiota bacterium]